MKKAKVTLARRVSAIDWDGLSRGQAKGFAQAFAGLGDAKKRKKALATVRNLLVRRDDLAYPIAGLAMPFFVELLASDAVDRAALIVLMTDIALWNHGRWIDEGFVPEASAASFMAGRARARTYTAFAKGRPAYVALLSAEDPAVRAAAAFALAWIHPAETNRLAKALASESSALVRASIMLSLAVLRAESAGDPCARALDAADPLERVCAAIACSFLAATRDDPRVGSVLEETTAPVTAALPWCSGDLGALANARLIASVFGEAPRERPASPPKLTPAQQATLRTLISGELSGVVRACLVERGFPEQDHALRRLAGLPRAVPEGKHAAVYDRWMTWAETGQPDARAVAAELASEVKLDDAIAIIEAMYYAEQESESVSDWKPPELPRPIPSPDPKEDYSDESSFYRWYRGTPDDNVSAYEALLRAEGFATWSHLLDGADDLNNGEVVAWHPDGREVSVTFDQRGDLVRASYEWNRSLVRVFTRALVERHGGAKLVACLRKHKKSGMRQAIGLLRVGWEIADCTKEAPDEVCDELAFAAGTDRHYIYWATRAHFDRISEARREKLVLRLLGKENGDTVFGWARFAPTAAVRAAASKRIPKTFGTSYYDLDGAESAANRMMPFVDDSLVPLLKKHVAADENPTMQVILLGRLGRFDLVERALESEYPMARAAAKKALDSVQSVRS